MRTDIVPKQDPTIAKRDSVSVVVYRTGTFDDIISGNVGGLTSADLSPFVVSPATHTSTELRLQLSYQNELIGANRPRNGNIVVVKVDGVTVFTGVIENYSDDEQRGAPRRTASLTAKRRDVTPWWREARFVSDPFSVGTNLGTMIRMVLERQLGLTQSEYEVPNLGVSLVHDSYQFADMTGWAIMEQIAQTVLCVPYIDARGRFKLISRDLGREPDLHITDEMLVGKGRSYDRPAATAVLVKWLDPTLAKVTQQERSLVTATLTAGFFKWRQTKDLWWSDDRTLRAENTRLVVQASINDGLLPSIGTETYEQTSDFGGRIRTQINAFLPTLATAGLAGLYGASKIPDAVQVGISGTGTTISVGRVAHAAAEVTLMLSLMTLGQGIYEVWGTPYDFVHLVNEVEAYDEEAEDWRQKRDEIENFLLPSAQAAESLAINELKFRAKSPQHSSPIIADDMRLECGDLVHLPDGRTLYVEDYTRDLARGSDALLQLEGFYV